MAKLLHILPLPTLDSIVQEELYERGFMIAGVSTTSLDPFQRIYDSNNKMIIMCNQFYFGPAFQTLNSNQRIEILYKELLTAALAGKNVLLFAQGFFGLVLYKILKEDWIHNLMLDGATEYEVSTDSAFNVEDPEEAENAIYSAAPLLVRRRPYKREVEYDFNIQLCGSVKGFLRELQIEYQRLTPATKHLIREGTLLN